MKKRRLISTILSAALLGTMLNSTVLAADPSADGATRTLYDQNFDSCDWFNDDGTISNYDQFSRSSFFNYLDENDGNNMSTSYKLENVDGRESNDKSLHINAIFKLPFGQKPDGSNVDNMPQDWSAYVGDWGQNGNGDRGNNGVSHRMTLPQDQNIMDANENFIHISFSAAQDPMPEVPVLGNNGAGLEVLFDFKTRDSESNLVNADNIRGLEWSTNNRMQAVFDDMRYEVGVPDTEPVTAGNWICYDYIINKNAKTADVYLNGYRVVKDWSIASKITSNAGESPIEGLNKLNFQIRDINMGDGSWRDVHVYLDDIKVTYCENAPVVSPQSVFGEKANIDAPEKYVNNEMGVIYNYGQSLSDIKKYFPDKQVSLVAVKWNQEPTAWWTEVTESLVDSSRPLKNGTIVNPSLCVQDGKFTYCYEVKQPQATNISATIDGNTLTWSGNSDDCQGIEIFRNEERIAALDGSATEYTVDDDKAEYTIRELLSDGNVSVLVVPSSKDGTRIIYSENFNDKTWWEGENSAPSEDKFRRTPFFSYLDENEGQNLESIYKLETGANGRASNDKSLHINEKFKLGYSLKPDNDGVPDSTEDGLWVGTWDSISVGTNGVSHRMASNSDTMRDEEKYLHISFSAAQDPMPQETISGEHGAGLDVSFDFITSNGNVNNKEMLHWYSRRQQGVFSTFYEIRSDENKWVNYDYVFDTAEKTMDIYVNGYPMVQGKDISNEISQITGLSQLNFQVRDVNTGEPQRDVHVYLDDIKVAYSKENPGVSPYASFGEAAYIDAPERYVDNEAGIIYNYGQGLSGISQYIKGKDKVYLVKPTDDSTVDWQRLEEYSSNSLDAVTLNDGRTVNPILYVEDGNFTYCYTIKQTLATSIKLVISDIAQDSITLSWDNKSDNCKAIEIFKNGERIATLDGSAQSYTDRDVVIGQKYEYCIREIVGDGNATKFSDTLSTFISSVGRPENFAAVLSTEQLAVKLTWAKPKYGNVAEYEIYRDGALLAAVGADVTEYMDSSALQVGTEYCYSVVAVGTDSAKSDKTSEIKIVADVISPPQNVKAEDADGNIRLSWDSVEGAKGYEVYRNGARVAQTADSYYVLTDCEDDSFYEFFVKTVNAAGKASLASETASYLKCGSRFEVFYDVFGDTMGNGLSYTTTNAAAIESGREYGVVGTNGIRIGFNSKHYDGQFAGFSARNELDLSRIKNSAGEIRFLVYAPEGLDMSKISFGFAQNYRSNLAGGTVKLKAAVTLDKYVKKTGWNFVRIPLKELPEKGAYTASSANLPYETKFDYSKVTEIGFFSKLIGFNENTYFMADEIAIYANQPPKVVSVTANGAQLANGATISGKTNKFSVKFDTEMDERGLSSDELKVVSSNKKVPSIVEYDEQTDEYTICLLDNLEANTSYSVVIENAVSKGGTVQKQKHTVSFKTDNSTVTEEPIAKTVEMNLQNMSGTTNEPIVQNLNFAGGAANEAVCGFDIEISYDSDKLLLNKSDVKIASSLKNSGIQVVSSTGKLRIYRTADKANNMSLKDGIGTLAIRAEEAGTSRISVSGKLYSYYSDADAMKEFAVKGDATISAVKGSGGGTGGSGGPHGGGSSSIGGSRPVAGGESIVTPPAKTIFNDISSVEWAREGILYLSEKNVINGYEDNTFRPNNSITREEFVAIIVRAFGIEDENAVSDFSDVNKSEWYYKYVSSAVNAGIIKGIDDDTFGTGETISRQDMCTIMSRIIESKNLVIDKKYSELEFSDYGEIADYAKEAVKELQQMGIINGMGDNMFVPGGEVTRAMAAKVVYQMIQE